MNRRTTAAGAVGLILGLLLLVILVAPRFIDSVRLRHQIVEQLSQQLHATVQLGAIRIALVPLPHVVVENASVTIPGVVSGTIESASIAPKLWALFRAKIELSHIRLVRPDFRVELPAASGDQSEPGGGAAALKRSVVAALGGIGSIATAQAPGLQVAVHNGSVHFALGEHTAEINNLDAYADLPPGDLQLHLSCASNFWEHLSINASIDTAKPAGLAAIDLARFRPQSLPSTWLPAYVPSFGESEVNLTAKVVLGENDRVQVDADAAVPVLRLGRGEREVLVRAGHLGTTATFDSSTTKVVARDWRVDEPPLQLSGELDLDWQTPRAALKVEGREIDVAAVRHVATTLIEGNSVVHGIFNALRGGHVTNITVESVAPSLATLGAADALVIRGHLVDGEVHVPGPNLELRQAVGDATVANGVLTGEHLAARFGNSQASDGSVRVGLLGESRELNVDTAVQADAAELPTLIKRFIGNENVVQQLDRVSALAGTASGRLRLTGTTDRVTPSVDLSSFDVSGRMTDLQPLIRIKGGRFRYEPDAISLDGVDLSAGASTLSQGAGRLSLRDDATFDASAGSSRLTLGELYPWLTSAGWNTSAWSPESLAGTLVVRSLRISGPITAPENWRVELIGSAENLDIESANLRQHIALHYPVSITEMRLGRDPASGTSLSGNFAAPDGLTGAGDVL
ncbi:MAG TPA: hypothetical protein VMJ74_01120, partial [Pseudomonadales bacterium]|nr:hypothetical protein [Pseudomonadales bacterium]